jgi:hypothetical protein
MPVDDNKLHVTDFAQKIKQKYPDYASVDDADLVERIVRKHPTYADQVDLPQDFRLLHTTTGHPKIDDIYEQAGRAAGVDPNLLLEQGRNETIGFKPDVMYGRQDSPKAARGAGQFMAGTAPKYGLRVDGETDDRTDPVKSIHAQARYMKKLLNDFGGDESLALAGYNAGEYRQSLKNGKIPNIPETQKYVKSIGENLSASRAKGSGTLRSLVGQNQTPPPPTDVPQIPDTQSVETPPADRAALRDALQNDLATSKVPSVRQNIQKQLRAMDDEDRASSSASAAVPSPPPDDVANAPDNANPPQPGTNLTYLQHNGKTYLKVRDGANPNEMVVRDISLDKGGIKVAVKSDRGYQLFDENEPRTPPTTAVAAAAAAPSPAWLAGKTKPVTAITDAAVQKNYNDLLNKYGLADTEERRQRALEGTPLTTQETAALENLSNVQSQLTPEKPPIINRPIAQSVAGLPNPKLQRPAGKADSAAPQYDFEKTGVLNLKDGTQLKVSGDREGLKPGEFRLFSEDGTRFVFNPKAEGDQFKQEAALHVTPEEVSKFTDAEFTVDTEHTPPGMDKGEYVFRQAARLAGNKLVGRELSDAEVNALADYQKAARGAFVFGLESNKPVTEIEGNKYTFTKEGFAEAQKVLERLKIKSIADLRRNDDTAIENNITSRADLLRSDEANIGAVEESNKEYADAADELRRDKNGTLLDPVGYAARYVGNKAGELITGKSSDPTPEEIEASVAAQHRGALTKEEYATESAAAKKMESNGLAGNLVQGVGGLGGAGIFKTFAGVLRPFAALGIDGGAYESTLKQMHKLEVQGSPTDPESENFAQKGVRWAGATGVGLGKLAIMVRLGGEAGLSEAAAPVVAFGVDAVFDSLGSGKSVATAVRNGEKNALVGAVLGGAGQLSKIVERGVFAKTLSAEATEALKGLTPTEISAIKAGAMRVAPEIRNAWLLAKIAGTGTRVGAVAGGTLGAELASGTKPKDALDAAAQMVLFDLGMHHGAGGIKALSGKVVRVWKDGKFADYAVRGKDFFRYEKVPEGAVDAEVVTDPQSEAYQRSETAKDVTPQPQRHAEQPIAEQQSPQTSETQTTLNSGNRIGETTAAPLSDVPVRQQSQQSLTPPKPESEFTISRQVASVLQPDSPRSAVLITDDSHLDIIPESEQSKFALVPTSQGVLLVSKEKAAAQFGLDSNAKIADYVHGNGFESLTGKAEPVGDTSDGMAVRSEDAKGREPSTTTPETAPAQMQTDKTHFGEGEAANQEILPRAEASQVPNEPLRPVQTAERPNIAEELNNFAASSSAEPVSGKLAAREPSADAATTVQPRKTSLETGDKFSFPNNPEIFEVLPAGKFQNKGFYKLKNIQTGEIADRRLPALVIANKLNFTGSSSDEQSPVIEPSDEILFAKPTRLGRQIKSFVQKAQNAKGDPPNDILELGEVTPETAAKIKDATGLDATGFTHILDIPNVRHTFRQHGSPATEEPRGHVAITEDDFTLIPEVVRNPDTVERGDLTRRKRLETIVYSKRFNGNVIYVETVRQGKKNLAIQSLRKTKAKSAAPPVTNVQNVAPKNSTGINADAADNEDYNPDSKGNEPQYTRAFGGGGDEQQHSLLEAHREKSLAKDIAAFSDRYGELKDGEARGEFNREMTKAAVIKPDGNVLSLNPEAGELLRQAHQNAFGKTLADGFLGAYQNPRHTEMAREALGYLLPMDAAHKDVSRALLAQFDKAIAATPHRDTRLIITNADAPFGLKKAHQEELSHQVNERKGLKQQVAVQAVPKTAEGRAFQTHLQQGDYHGASDELAGKEVGAKSWLDDADAVTMLGAKNIDAVKKVRDSILDEFLDNGIDFDDIAADISEISESAKRHIEDYAKRNKLQRERESRTNGNTEEFNPATTKSSDLDGTGETALRQGNRNDSLEPVRRESQHRRRRFLEADRGFSGENQSLAPYSKLELARADKFLKEIGWGEGGDDEPLYARAPSAAPGQRNLIRRVVAKAIWNGRQTSVLDTVTALRRAGLLTGVKTHLRNITSNTAFQLTEEAHRPIAALVDIATSAFTGERTVQNLSPIAVAKSFRALVWKDDAIKAIGRENGVRTAWQIMLHGDTQANLAKQQLSELRSGFPVLDAYAALVFRSLSAEDAIFKVYSVRRSLEEQATALAKTEARQNKLPAGVSWRGRRRQLLASPTLLMQSEAVTEADFMTFQNPNVISGAIQDSKNYLKKNAGAGGAITNFAVETVMPFDKTPTNIVLRTLDYTPLGLARAGSALKTMGEHRAKHAPAGSVEEMMNKHFSRMEQARFAKSVGRASLGSAALALGILLASKGLLSGIYDPSDKEQQSEFFSRRDRGIENGSLDVPGIGRFSITDTPLGKIMATGATIFERSMKPAAASKAGDQRVDIAKDVSFSLVKDQPLLSTIDDYFGRNKTVVERAGSLLSSFIPTILGQAAEAGDDKARDTKLKGKPLMDRLLAPSMKKLPQVRGKLPVAERPRPPFLRNREHRILNMFDPLNSRPSQYPKKP